MQAKRVLAPRERVCLALAHQETDRVPIGMVCAGINAPAHAELEAYLQCERGLSVEAYLQPLIDIKAVEPQYIGPTLEQGEDVWGVRRRPVSYGSGTYDEIEHYPLAAAEDVGDLSAHRWPNPDWFDYTILAERVRQLRSGQPYCLMVANGNIFESAWYMRGLERVFLDMILRPELLHGIMSRVADFFVGYFTRILSAAPGEIDLVFTADDVGSQNGLLMSRTLWEEFIKPYHVRMNRAIHQFEGVKVIYHTDGAVMDIVDGLIDMGIDVLQALQFSARGMDPELLKARFGDRLCFQGGVSVQTTLPFGTPTDVHEEVQRLIRILGKGGGYILGPSHSIQAGTPPENIVALFDTASCFYPF